MRSLKGAARAVLGLLALSGLELGCGDDSGVGGEAGQAAGAGGAGGAGGVAANGGGGTGGSGGAGGAAPAELEFDWYTCPYIDGVGVAECASTEVPLDWSKPDGEKIPFFVKRVKAAVQPARGQLWILQGGPGSSGESILFTGPEFASVADDLDLYFPDHRGTGASAPLDCPDLADLAVTSRPLDPQAVESEIGQCIPSLTSTWGDGLSQFSATGAGRDLGEAIDALRAPGEEVYVYGVSYGTRWAHRYLQQFPTQPTGVIFDSMVGEPSTWLEFDANIDAMGQQLLELCGADPFCQSKLGPDPVAFVEALMAKLDAGHCPTSKGLDKNDYKALLAAFVVHSRVDRGTFPAIAYRIDRCDVTDQTVIENLYAALEPGAPATFSGGLHFNVVTGELIEAPPPSLAELTTAEDGLLLSSRQMLAYRAAYDVWPRYDRGPLDGTFADTDVPILMLQGALDAQTTAGPAAAFASHYAKPHQSYLEIAGVGHAITNPGTTQTLDGSVCGMTLAGQFLNDPTADVDTSCVADILPLDFELVGYSFGAGTVSVWENAAAFAAPPADAPKPVNVIELVAAERRRGGVR
ncbi:MAG: alpha/beta fold hydrolase [Polyangiaceae bacterium]